ncbi:MAG: TAXI family TRAP transporter solute-binding subunit [Proteobacteria bacterium]|nr:TAXI family TRAP transporter solute-binding subunit [Pseudomonadota bacterium]
MRIRNLSWRDALVVGLPVVALCVLAVWLTAHFVRPAPPSHLVMSTGPAGGTYEVAARRYQAILKRNGVTLELKPSAGSVENLQRLQDGSVDVALVQGGIALKAVPPDIDPDDAAIQSLGAMYFEPLWLFDRAAPAPTASLASFASRRIAVGPEGSGSRALASELLRLSGVGHADADLSPLAGDDAAAALVAGNVGAVFMVSGLAAPAISRLMHEPGVALVALTHADAFARLLSFVTPVTLPRGIVDVRADLPDHDVHTVAVTANLLVRGDMHPALMYLLLDAASDVHGGHSPLADTGYFPNLGRQDVPVAAEATRFYKQGKPFLRRYLPFWLANLVDRMLVVLIPLLGVLLPAMRFVPSLYTYRLHARITRGYASLRELEARMTGSHDDESVDRWLQELDRIEADVNALHLPTWFSKESYDLRAAIDLIRERLGHPEAKAVPALRRDS